MVDEKNGDSGWESQFPVGLRVLIVDDDPVCLSILRNMLSKCEYHDAFPKKILDLMNVEGLTREHVASHLQKYKFSLKRSAGQRYSVFGMSSSFGATRATNYISIDSHGNFNVPAPLTSSQMAPQSMVPLQAELPKGSNKYNQWRSTEDSFHEQATVRTEECNPLSKENFGQSSMTDEANIILMWPNDIGMKFPQIQKEMPSFSDVGKCTSQMCSRFPTTQDKITKGDVESESLGQICLLNIAESQSQPKDVFIMHFSQQQQLPAPQYLHPCIELPSPQLEGRHVQNLSYDNSLGTDVLLTDMGGSVPNDNVCGNNVIDESSPLQMNYMSSVACSLTPSTSVSFIENEIRSKVDYENYDLPISSVNNFSASGALRSSLPLSSIVRDFAVQVQGLKSVGGNNDMRTSETLSNICISSGLLEKINQHNRMGCEIQNTSKNPDLSHNVHPALLQGYSKACSGFSTEALNLPCIQASDAVPQRTISGVQSQRDDNLNDNGVGFQCKDTPDVIEYLTEGGPLFEEFSPSYDIMDPLFQ